MKIVILITVIESSAVMLAILYFYYRRRQLGKRALVFVAGKRKWKMSLTRSPCCHYLCFSDAAMCPWCGQAFWAGCAWASSNRRWASVQAECIRDIFQCVSGIVGAAGLFSTSKL